METELEAVVIRGDYAESRGLADGDALFYEFLALTEIGIHCAPPLE
jgi:hypothetical protein